MGRSEFLDSAHIGDGAVVRYGCMVYNRSGIASWHVEGQVRGGAYPPAGAPSGVPYRYQRLEFF